MPGYLGAITKWALKQPTTYLAAGGAIAGGAIGQAWNYSQGRNAGMWAGFTAGAGVGLSMATGHGVWKLGRTGISRIARQSMPGAIGGAVAGAMFGPTDSTLANIGLGTLAGASGHLMGAYAGSKFGNKYARMSINKFGMQYASGGIKSGNIHAGVRLTGGRKIGGKLSTATIGGTASALFAPAAAHALVGRSRQDKSQNTFNRY